jgi:hypothetical protein
MSATAVEMIAFCKECLEPDFGHAMLRFGRHHLGNEDGFHVLYNSVPKGTTGVAVDNAFSTPKFSISAATGEKWPWDGEVSKVKLEMFSGSVHEGKSFRGPKVPFRAKTGTPEKVLEYLVAFFMEHKDALLP